MSVPNAYVYNAGLTLYQSQVSSSSNTVELLFIKVFLEAKTKDLYKYDCKYLTAFSRSTKMHRRSKLPAYLSRKFSRQIMWSLIRLFSLPGGRDKKMRSTVSRLQHNKPLEKPWQR